MTRNPALDGLRAIAVLMVLATHLAWLPFGYLGVDLFFALSGFLLGGQLLDAGRVDAAVLRGFYVRRAFRILPLYAVLLASYLALSVVAPAHAGPRSQTWLYFVFAQNLVEVRWPQWLIVTWSLAVEEHFYAVLPWAIKLVRRRALPFVCYAAAAASLASRFVGAIWGPQRIIYFATWSRLDGLAAGVFMAWLLRSEHRPSRRALVAVAALCTVPACAGWLGGRWSPLTSTAAAVGFSALVGAASLAGGDWRALCSRPLAWIGGRSYALYLLHFPVYVAVAVALGVAPDAMDRRCAIAALALTPLIAEASWRALEWPAQRFGRRLATAALQSDPVHVVTQRPDLHAVGEVHARHLEAPLLR